jgi:hypothetical protein
MMFARIAVLRALNADARRDWALHPGREQAQQSVKPSPRFQRLSAVAGGGT